MAAKKTAKKTAKKPASERGTKPPSSKRAKRSAASATKKAERGAKREKTARERAEKKAGREKKKAERAEKKAAREKKRAARAEKRAESTKVASARKERRLKKQDVRQGEKKARTTFRSGNKSCRTERKRRDTPHRDALKRSRVDFDKCRRIVEQNTVAIVAPLADTEREIRALDAFIPAPTPNYRARRNQELWEERLEAARNDVEHAHPELRRHLETFLGSMKRFGSRSAREARARADKLIGGRPAMTMAELALHTAHDEGWSPQSGLGGNLGAAAASKDAASLRRFLAAGDPRGPKTMASPFAGAFGPSSAAAPSARSLPLSAFDFPPWSAADQIVASVRSQRPAPSSRRGAPSRRPTSKRGKAPKSRKPSKRTAKRTTKKTVRKRARK